MIGIQNRRRVAGALSYGDSHLTFKALGDGDFWFTKRGTGNDIQYSIDSGAWTSLASDVHISVTKGQTVRWSAVLTPNTTSGSEGVGTFNASCDFEVFGTVFSILTTSIYNTLSNKNYALYGLFRNNTHLISAEFLKLEYIIGASCYAYMFYGCTGLINAPVLPAVQLSNGCYSYMFYGCTSLANAPKLPARNLTQDCYKYMFSGCSTLLKAPELLASVVVTGCYQGMFNGCTALNYIKMLADKVAQNASNCFTDWVYDVAESGEFVKHSTMSLPIGSSGMPSGWIVNIDYSVDYLTIVSRVDNNVIGWKASDASLLKTIEVSTDGETWTEYTSSTNGTTLATLDNGEALYIKGNNNAYGTADYYNSFTSSGAFDVQGNIMSLIYGDDFVGKKVLTASYTFKYLFFSTAVVNAENLILQAESISPYCYFAMFYTCSNLISTPKLPAKILQEHCYHAMFNACTSLTTTPDLHAIALADYCYNTMFYGCTMLTKAPDILPATILKTCCYNAMFYGAGITNTPILPAATMVYGCYTSMFRDCSNLNKVVCLARYNLTAYQCLSSMLLNTPSAGTFYIHDDVTDFPFSSTGMPSGWTVKNYYQSMPMTIESLSDNNVIGWKASAAGIEKTIEVSTDGGETWVSKTSSTDGVTLAVLNVGDKMLVRGNNDAYADTSNNNSFTSTKYFNVYGNAHSLIDSVNYESITAHSSANQRVFKKLFYQCGKLIHAENLKLPAVTLAYECYREMFSECSNLQTMPKLVVQQIVNNSYWNMFFYCVSLKTAYIKATNNIAHYGCYYMFYNCISLQSATIEVGILTGNYACECMFYGCANLTKLVCTAKNIGSNSTGAWVSGVNLNGDFVVPNSMRITWDAKAAGSGKPTNFTYVDYVEE